MKIRVTREACCAQDDQLGPLEASHELPDGASLRHVVERVEGSGFLQYSSSHFSLVGTAKSTELVRVFSRYYCDNRPAEYFVSPEAGARALLEEDGLSFRFTDLQPAAVSLPQG